MGASIDLPMMKAPISVLVLLAGCASTAVPPGPADASAPPGPVSADASAPPPDLGSDAAAPVTAGLCLEAPTPQPGSRAAVTVDVELTYDGQPLVFGEPLRLPAGTLTVTNLRFYVSEFHALTSNGETAVDVIEGDGAPAPYNVHLVNAEDPAALTFRLAVPPGQYTGLSFLLGITDTCNRGDPASRRPPLTSSSQMTWPPPFGYLFLRYAGTISGATNDRPPTQIDVGGFPGVLLAPRVTAPGQLAVRDLSAHKVRMRVALDELFRAAALPATLDEAGKVLSSAPVSGPAFEAGEHVRQNANRVALFWLIDGQ